MNVEETRTEFESLLAKFKQTVDPVERYIKRLEMAKLQKFLHDMNVEVDVP